MAIAERLVTTSRSKKHHDDGDRYISSAAKTTAERNAPELTRMLARESHARAATFSAPRKAKSGCGPRIVARGSGREAEHPR